jgi:hypothetical protein
MINDKSDIALANNIMVWGIPKKMVFLLYYAGEEHEDRLFLRVNHIYQILILHQNL